MAFGDSPFAPTNKLVARYNTHANSTIGKLPTKLGSDSVPVEQQQAAPMDGSTMSARPTAADQPDSINSPQAGQDLYASDGTQGIRAMGTAATNQVKIEKQNEVDKANAETNKGIQDQFNSGVTSVGAALDKNSQQGVSLAPKLGANNSATWINNNVGLHHDYDGQYGAQCVDLYNFYMTGFVGGKASAGTGVQYAEQLWNNHDTSALVQVAKNQTPQMGDVAIWSNGLNGIGGHVAIVAQPNTNGTIRVLNANAANGGGSTGVTVMTNISTGTLLGYLRPRKLM